MLRPRTLVLLALVCAIGLAATAPAGAASAPYQTGFTRWRAADNGFAGWTLSGVKRDATNALQLDSSTATSGTDPYGPGGYNGKNFYNGGSFLVGEATSPAMTTSFGFQEAIASWNAATPPGTWIETQISAHVVDPKVGAHWTKWYSLGVWAADGSTVERHSVNLQGNADGFVAVDTLVLADKLSADTFQLKVRLFSETSAATPSVRNMSVAHSTSAQKAGTLAPGDPSRWNTLLTVPECSQMVYPDGGEVWCSPTSTSMVLGYWGDNAPDCSTRVHAAVNGVYDWVYDGHGNWPFNTAYAATQGLEGYVARFTSMAQIEPWVAAGVPVVISYPWKKGSLDDAPIASSNGHLAVIVGFDPAGNPIVNDPAAADNPDVQRTYRRDQFEPLWLENSGGTVYLMYPAGWTVPNL
jgi:hypothetical protein